MTYDEWLASVPKTVTNDPLWQMRVYRQALFLGDLAWHDASRLVNDPRTRSLSDQLYRAAGGISASVGEGFSRAFLKDQARLYEYALGSAREARDWYFKSRFLLGNEVAEHRMQLLAHVIRQLLAMMPKYRGRRIGEAPVGYEAQPAADLLSTVPMPNTQ